jgi:hypothetical protein
MDNKILTSYSFIASLNENGNDFYNAVYIPLCKRAMSLYAKNKTKGKDADIQKIILNEYGINVPLIIVRKLIVAIGRDLSKREKEKYGYQYFESGKSFQFESYTFTLLEEEYERQRRQANALQLAFETYITLGEKEDKSIPTFTEFIVRYKNELSSFLSGRINSMDNLNVESSFMQHVRFLQYIETNNDVLYKVVEHIYIGAIIASYIEANIDIEAKAGKAITYFLDTKIVLEALDLQNQEDTRPTLELLQLIRDSGGDIRILDVTISEIHGIITTAINNFNKNNPTTTINEACVRIGKNKSWLTTINGQLEKYITEELKVNVSKVSESDIKEFSSSKDAESLQKIWYRKNAAAHDVIAYLYVRKRRKQDSNRTLIQKASSWFITANRRLCNFNISKKENGYPCETIMPQELTSLLFLQNPKKYSSEVSNIGLGELIAQTLFDEYPSKDIINEFDTAIRENTDISQEDYRILLSAVSQESTSKLQCLLEEKADNNDKFISEIHTIIARERKKQIEAEQQRKNAVEQHSRDEKEKDDLNKINKELSNKINAISKQIEELQKTSLLEKEKNQKLSEDNKKLKLEKWKLPRYIVFLLLLCICIGVFFLYFVMQDWQYNYAKVILNYIDTLKGTKHDIAKGTLILTHVSAFLLSLNSIISLAMIEKEEERKHWFLKLIKFIINK